MSKETPTDEDASSLKRLLVQTAASILIIFGASVLAGTLFLEQLNQVGQDFVGALGGPGLFLCYFAMDAFLLPLPQDPFATLALSGGLPFSEIVFWAGLGSVIGGVVGFGLGRWVSQFRSVQRRFRDRLTRGEAFMRRWGVAAVLIAGITPFPYSVVGWVGGALRMSFWKFLVASIAIRFVRVASYLWVIEKGLGV